MWNPDSFTSNNSKKDGHQQQKMKSLNANAPDFQSQKSDELALLIDDLCIGEKNRNINSSATTKETISRSGPSSRDASLDWNLGYHPKGYNSSLHDSLDRNDYSTNNNWSSLQISCPDPQELPSRNDYRQMHGGEVFPSTEYGSSASERVARQQSYDSYASPATGYHRVGAFSPAPSPNSNSYYGHPPLSGAAKSVGSLRTPIKPPRSMEPVDGFIYQVQFKRAHKNYILAPSAPRNIIPGDFVKVEADRGEDMGIVLSKQRCEEFEEVIPTAGYRGRGFSSGQGEKKFLFRVATSEERMALVEKVRDEDQALMVIREKATERGLPMVVLDAEYQFDRHKLTFFFEADRRIDFRELVSELFSQYKTRIWMQQVDTTTISHQDAGTELAMATGFLPARDDHGYLQQPTEHHDQVRNGGQYRGQMNPKSPFVDPWARDSQEQVQNEAFDVFHNMRNDPYAFGKQHK